MGSHLNQEDEPNPEDEKEKENKKEIIDINGEIGAGILNAMGKQQSDKHSTVMTMHVEGDTREEGDRATLEKKGE